MPKRRIRARVTGRVQGVGFRYFTWSLGRELGLVGYVRNESDGSVLIEAQGSTDAVAQLLERVQRGPAHARVEQTAAEERNCRRRRTLVSSRSARRTRISH